MGWRAGGRPPFTAAHGIRRDRRWRMRAANVSIAYGCNRLTDFNPTRGEIAPARDMDRAAKAGEFANTCPITRNLRPTPPGKRGRPSGRPSRSPTVLAVSGPKLWYLGRLACWPHPPTRRWISEQDRERSPVSRFSGIFSFLKKTAHARHARTTTKQTRNHFASKTKNQTRS